MLTHPVALYWHQADQLCFMVPTSSWAPCKQGPLPLLTSLVWLDPAPTGNRTHKSSWSVLGPPYHRFLQSAGATGHCIVIYQGCKSGSMKKSEIIPKKDSENLNLRKKTHMKHALRMNFFRGIKVNNFEIRLKSENLHPWDCIIRREYLMSWVILY